LRAGEGSFTSPADLALDYIAKVIITLAGSARLWKTDLAARVIVALTPTGAQSDRSMAQHPNLDPSAVHP